MSCSRRSICAITVLVIGVALSGSAAASASTGAYVLTATSMAGRYAPTFTGNGELGVRVPPAGQGYAGGTVPAQSELAGFYAQPPRDVQQRANIPTWSTLQFSDGGATFSPGVGAISNWRQSIDLHTGIVTTSARWMAPSGHVTDLAYQVLTDRARPDIGLVRLTFTPQWSGTANVTDLIDGSPAKLSTQVDKGWADPSRRDWVTVKTVGTNITAALASQLAISGNISATLGHTAQTTSQSVGQQLSFPVSTGQHYAITKYIAVESSPSSTTSPLATALGAVGQAATTGFDALLRENNAAWATLWNGRIDISGNKPLADYVNASEFYLWSSTRAGVDWSVSPAGLSSNGYDGHIFWDAETWMYPSLLAQHPEIAAGMNNYRFQRLPAAIQHAKDTGWLGARFPWESALDGTEQIPPPVSVNSEGLYEQHITSDVALAQWQYYLVTGDRTWLRQRGWPVLSGAAAFWASRATRGSDGRYHISHVTGPDEENPNVNDEAYTNVSAKTTLLDAIAAAREVGAGTPASWTKIAHGIVVPPNRSLGVHPEFTGYGGQLVKQADVTLMQYPWASPMSRSVAQNDLDFYVPRSDPGGPSMTDAISSIDSSALGTPGCSSYVYTQRSYEPFLRDVFNQFSETRTGGAFTFMTGIGGFLQEFLYGYSGLRWQPSGIRIDPSLTRQLSGVVLHNLSWRGRRFTISIGSRRTTITLDAGSPLPLTTLHGVRVARSGQPVVLSTRRPDLVKTGDAVLCGRVAATSASLGSPALAAVDGSPATGWQPASQTGTLSGRMLGSRQIRFATLRWGREWPQPPKPNVHPPAGPVKTLRASSYLLQLSSDGRIWRTVARVSGRNRGTVDAFSFRAVRARFYRLRVTKSNTAKPPMLQELLLNG